MGIRLMGSRVVGTEVWGYLWDKRHGGERTGQVSVTTSRLSLALDDHSSRGRADRPENGIAPLSWCSQHQRQREAIPVPAPLRTTNEGTDMVKSTQGLSPYDSRTRISGVKITPPSEPGTATTPAVA